MMVRHPDHRDIANYGRRARPRVARVTRGAHTFLARTQFNLHTHISFLCEISSRISRVVQRLHYFHPPLNINHKWSTSKSHPLLSHW